MFVSGSQDNLHAQDLCDYYRRCPPVDAGLVRSEYGITYWIRNLGFSSYGLLPGICMRLHYPRVTLLFEINRFDDGKNSDHFVRDALVTRMQLRVKSKIDISYALITPTSTINGTF